MALDDRIVEVVTVINLTDEENANSPLMLHSSMTSGLCWIDSRQAVPSFALGTLPLVRIVVSVSAEM